MPMTDQRRWVCLDVGETLIDETRVWSIWADELRIPRLTFMAALGATIARGGQHGDVFGVFGYSRDDWRARAPRVDERYGGFRSEDLYPDALSAVDALKAAGYRVAVIGNQPAQRTAELTALGVAPEVVAMSGELGVAKPDPAFFARSLELLGSPEPTRVAYVGDRVDNDVLPSAAAGMRAVWLRRGPWGIINEPPPDGVASLVVRSLDELVERLGELWPED
jgi:FMN hydrolase / 5-amino-6-(5-phospho-D-ribitylamino)uracil phosphatase